MNDFIALVKEGFRLAWNLGKLAVETVKAAVLAYFRGVKKWTIRFFITAVAPLVVIVPCLVFHVPFGGLYGAYVVLLVLLFAAELILITPMFLIWWRLKVLLPDVAKDLEDWVDFIKSVLFNGLSLGIFVTLFPIWRAPGAFPLLLLVLVCWLTLPACAFSHFCKRIYPTVRGIQLLVLFGLLVLQMAFPRQMEQLGWASGRKIGGILTASVTQKEITGDWNTIPWFNNAGEPLAWYSGSDSESYRLWAAPGFDPDSGKELQPVRDEKTRAKIVASLSARERTLQRQTAAEQAEIARKADVRHREEQDRLAKEREASAKQAEELAAERARQATEQAKKEAEQQQAKKQARYLAHIEPVRASASPRIVVLAANNGEGDSVLTGAVGSMAERSGFAVVKGLLKPELVSDGLFTAAFEGHWDSLAELSLTNRCEFVALCQFSETTEARPAFQDVTGTSGKLHLKLFRAETGSVVCEKEYTATAAAFQSAQGLNALRKKLTDLLATNTIPLPVAKQ